MSVKSGDRMRGIFLSEQAMNIARSIRDEDFDLLNAGTFGTQIGTDGRWEFIGTPVETEDGFLTEVTITLPETNRATISAQTTWSFGRERTGTISLVTDLTNWRVTNTLGDWSNVSLEGGYTDSGTPLFNSIALSGTAAFVTSEAAGAGLYLFDTTNTALPSRIASSFALGGAGYEVAVSGTGLYVLTSKAAAEIEVYDISNPSTFSSANLLNTYDLPGSGRARSLSVFSDTLFVGAIESATQDEYYSFDVTDPSDISLLDSLNNDGGILDSNLHNGYAYTASTRDVAELVVIDIFDPANLDFATGEGYNLPDTPDGLSSAAFGTGVLIGRSVGSSISEFVLFDIASNPVPAPPPGPWFHTVGADERAIDHEPSGQYAFIASDFVNQELQVMDIHIFSQGGLPRVETYSTSGTAGRSVTYDMQRDRLFFTTNNQLLILAPN